MLTTLWNKVNYIREIHPLDPQPHRHSMLVPSVCAPRVTRCSLGKYWSRDFFQKKAGGAGRMLAGIQACATREIHPLEPQRHRHSMLAPRVCAPRVTRCSLGHVIWSVQLACSILSRSDSCQGDGRQRCMHSARSRSTHLRRNWFRGNFSLTQGLWNQQAANPGVHRLSMTHSGVRQRNLMMHAQCPPGS